MPEIILVSAFLLDLILGEPPTQFHPTVWMGSYIQWFWKICPKGSKRIEFLWGTLLILSGVFLFAGFMILLSSVFSSYSLLFVFLSVPLLIASCSVRALLISGYHIKKELENGNLVEARKLTSYHLVSRNTETLTEEEICSCVIESLSENITDSFSSPILYFLLFGLPGSWAYRLVNTSDSMIAYRNGEFE
ncbi:CobD/CbiB family cobalamin biosynthesis protein, partial [Oceanispirochaeta sp.]|uniref:CobD/CbiB family cobalamin biosynthesis protein n=1 Tax=Oceanispirochaeta sp. TaxID=2035350 RepID=UPI0026229BF8